MKARVTPEHKIKQTPYPVTVEIDTVSDQIEEARCHGCQARNGGCKHVAAFVLWLHRRSSDPSVTEVTCYWKKAKLSNVANLSPMKAKNLGNGSRAKGATGSSKKKKFLETCLKHATETGLQPNGVVFQMVESQDLNPVVDVRQAYMDQLCCGLSASSVISGALTNKVSQELVELVCSETSQQAMSAVWHHLRYGRITASKLYEVAQCGTVHGSLVETILGARKFKGNDATHRGQRLEPLVLSQLGRVRGLQLKRTGLHIMSSKPMFAASPDALCNVGGQRCVVEVKCPTAAKTVNLYVSENGMAPKVRAQLQLQMVAAGASRGILCVADPAFERSGSITIVDDELDRQFIDPIMERAERFWVHAVLPMLLGR